MSEPLRLLAVFAHPDDESLGLGGVLAKYAAEGMETHLVCATRGQRGWTGPAEENPGPDILGKIREGELRCAADHLGIQEVTLLDYCDGEMEDVSSSELIANVTAQIRRIRPQVVVTFALDGVYGHPDHIIMAQAAAGALVCAADASYADPLQQQPHRVSKFYSTVDTRAVVRAFEEAVGPISMEIDGVLRQHVGWEEWTITTRLDVRPYFDQVWQAVLCHQSQLPAFGSLVDQPREVLLDLFAGGTLVRHYSLVDTGPGIETDLFAGIRESVVVR